MSIPLVQENTKDAINTSIIAIKRNIERINSLLGLSGSEEIDTSIFATKEELEALETALQPVDEVTVDNMQSVTSNAVARAIGDVNSELNTAMRPRFPSGITCTVADFLTYIVNGTSATGCFGSADLTDGPYGNTWYCFLFIPHRDGVGADNYLYGVLLLMPMVADDSVIWINHLINGAWFGFRQI